MSEHPDPEPLDPEPPIDKPDPTDPVKVRKNQLSLFNLADMTFIAMGP